MERQVRPLALPSHGPLPHKLKTYTLEIATDAGFTNIVHTGTGITGTTYSGATLSTDTQYFWRVRAVNPCGPGTNSAVFSFRTALICTSTVSYTGPPVAIPDNVAAGVNIPISVSGVGAVTDLNFQFDTAGTCDATVGNVNAAMDHTFSGDLTFKLTPPDGSPTVSFQARRGGTRENICLSLLDDEGGFPNISTLTSATGQFQSGNFSPETTGMFSLLDGESADGTWTLNVSDNAGIDTGSMRRFSLIFNTGGTSCGGTPSPTPTASPSNTPTSTATSTASATGTATATPTASPSASPSCGVTTSYTGPAVAIPHNVAAGVNINIPVSGVGTVSDLNFRFDTAGTCDATVGNANAAMDHTFIGDLTFKLTAPNGTTTTTFQARRGGTRENICLTNINDEGGFPNVSTLTSVTGQFESGNFSPETTGPLSVFDGTNADGTWVLNVSDNAGIDTGSMRRFSLIFNGDSCGTATATATPTGTVPTSSVTNTPTPTATATGTPSGPTMQFGSATFAEDESQVASITINRTGSVTGSSTVNFSTSDGTATGGAACTSGVDYISVTNQLVTFAANDTSKTVNVTICGDTLTEPVQTINMTLSGATGGTVGSPGTAVLNINDTASAFRSTGAICTTFGQPASPYPSTINVTGVPLVGSMRVTLFDVAHTVPDSMDFLLVGPGGQKFVLMADSGGILDLATPVTLTFSDLAGQVLPDSAPLTTGVFEPTSWIPGQTSFPAPAPAAPYNEPGSTVGGTGTQTLSGNFAGLNGNGTWSLYMRDDAGSFTNAITGCVNGGWGLELFSSTAANASISGRVMTADGAGIRNAKIVVTGNSLAEPRVVTTGSFGYFSIEGLQTGQTYVVTVNSQRYTFTTPSQVVSLVDNVADMNFVASESE